MANPNDIIINGAIHGGSGTFTIAESGRMILGDKELAYTEDVDNSVGETDAVLDKHRNTDRFRWQDSYDAELDSMVRSAHTQGLTLDGVFQTVAYPYTVTDEYGGIVKMSFMNPDEDTSYQVELNDKTIYDSDGLPTGITVIKYYTVAEGDVLTINGGTNPVQYVPFMSDPESPFYKMVQQVTANQQMIGTLQNNILDIQASIDNKVLDPDPSHVEDILNTTYTVSNTLGGRLNGIGYVLLGLLGVRLVATGTVDVTYTNETTIREYDNTALVGAGEANPFVLDVDTGTVIVSSGMSGLTFTPYIPK